MTKRLMLLVVLTAMLPACGGHAEWARRGEGDGELMLKGEQDQAFAEAEQMIRTTCGGDAEVNRNTMSQGKLLTGRGGSGMVHYKCKRAAAR